MLGLMGFSGSLPLYVVHRCYIFVCWLGDKDACLLAYLQAPLLIVKWKGTILELSTIDIGVPQSSSLGPILWSLVCDDMSTSRLVARTSTCLGDRSFAAAVPRLWNSLPTYLRQPDLSLGQFRRALKTHLFLAAWLRRLVTICFSAPLYKYPYLLTYLVQLETLERCVARAHDWLLNNGSSLNSSKSDRVYVRRNNYEDNSQWTESGKSETILLYRKFGDGKLWLVPHERAGLLVLELELVTPNIAAACCPPSSTHTYVPASENCGWLMTRLTTVGLVERGVMLYREMLVQ